MTPRLIAKRAEQLNFCLVAVKVVRCFKIKRQVIKNGMSDYSFHGVKPNIAFTYAFVSILMTAERIFTVIYMYGSKLFKAYYSVKIRKHLVKRVYNRSRRQKRGTCQGTRRLFHSIRYGRVFLEAHQSFCRPLCPFLPWFPKARW